MRRARRAVPMTQDQRIAQRVNAVEADPPGWRTGRSSDNGPLRWIRGSVNTSASPSIVAGTGFTVAGGTAGIVTVTFTTAFPTGLPPSVVATSESATVQIGRVNVTPTVTAVGLITHSLANVAAGAVIHFIAVGLASSP